MTSLGIEMDADDLVHRHMKIVVEFDVILGAELTVGTGINNVPVKLLGGDLNVKITGRNCFSTSPRC